MQNITATKTDFPPFFLKKNCHLRSFFVYLIDLQVLKFIDSQFFITA